MNMNKKWPLANSLYHNLLDFGSYIQYRMGVPILNKAISDNTTDCIKSFLCQTINLILDRPIYSTVRCLVYMPVIQSKLSLTFTQIMFFLPILNACLIRFYTLCQLKAVPSIQTDLAVGASLWFNICELNYWCEPHECQAPEKNPCFPIGDRK